MDDGRSADSTGVGAGADDGWQQVKDDAAVLQQGVSPAVVLQSSVYDQRVQLLRGRFAALGPDGEDEVGDCAAAEVDTSGSQFSQQRSQHYPPARCTRCFFIGCLHLGICATRHWED